MTRNNSIPRPQDLSITVWKFQLLSFADYRSSGSDMDKLKYIVQDSSHNDNLA